jgi:microcystin-dependent protein
MGATPIIGSIRAVGFNFTENGWLPCDGRLLQINQYQILFSLLGTMYGGDGRTTFGLPDMRSRATAGQNPNGFPGGISINQGEMTGWESVPLTTSQMPVHGHLLNRKNNTNRTDKISTVSPNASLNFLGGIGSSGVMDAIQTFAAQVPPNPPPNLDVAFAPQAMGPTGQGMAHENRQPFLALNYQICTDGDYPVRPD